jgi:hypothetical protein
MIDDEELVDALDDIRQSVTTELLVRLEEMVAACRHYTARGSKTDAAILGGMEALLSLARMSQ